jgi:2-desacetyl-2-hydroxyethyl bacteriochlorophyllide A dehydrogenase
MREALLERPGELVLVERAEPSTPGPGEVLVAVRRVGICGTDLHAYGGRQNFFAYPRVLGHELAVEVLDVGAGIDGVRPGDRCAVLPYLSCGTCGGCARGRANCCERINVLGVTLDGGLRERMLVPGAHLFADPYFTYDQLVLVETLGIGWHAVVRADPGPTDLVLILGAGPIGLAVAQAARLRTERVVIADIAPERVAFAAAAGLTAIPVDGDLGPQLRELGGGQLPTVVFDATGNRASMESALTLTDQGGVVVFVGHTTGDVTIHNPTFHARELDLRASRNATFADWDGVMAAVRSGTLDATGWINHRTTLEGIIDELPRIAAAPGAVVKSVVEIGASTVPA